MFLFYTLDTFADSPLLSINTDYELIIPVVRRILTTYKYAVLDLSLDDVIYIQLYPDQSYLSFKHFMIELINSLDVKSLEISGFNYNGEITPYTVELPVVTFEL